MGSYAVLATLQESTKNCQYIDQSKNDVDYTNAHQCAMSIVDIETLYDVTTTIYTDTIMINTRPLDHTQIETVGQNICDAGNSSIQAVTPGSIS